MNRVIPIIAVVLLTVSGLIIKFIRINKYVERLEFTIDFNNRFFDFVNSFFAEWKMDNEKYNSVIKDVDKIQQELGLAGVLSSFYDPLKGIQGRNYQLFMNIIPEIRYLLYDRYDSISSERVQQLVGLCEDSLKRHIGHLERSIEIEKKGLCNPVHCMGEGIRWIVGLPIDILQWVGIYGEITTNKIKSNFVYKLFNNVIIIIGLISSIIGIVLGWDEFIQILENFLEK